MRTSVTSLANSLQMSKSIIIDTMLPDEAARSPISEIVLSRNDRKTYSKAT